MSTRLSGSLLLLVALVLLLNAGEFAAQDPVPATPAPQATAPDLSGTYAGTFNCDALGLTGDTTLTITGNQFTTADGKTGRIVASKSGGYTAVAFQVGEMNPTTQPAAAGTQPAAPQIVSMRARKSGNRLTLTSAPGSMMKCSFTTGATARGRRQRTPAATGTEVSAPVTAPTEPTAPVPAKPPSEPMPAQTPAPSPMPSPSPEPTPEPSPEPNPSPAPSPAPTPNPSPMPSPTVSPSPTPSPTPTPNPTSGHRRG